MGATATGTTARILREDLAARFAEMRARTWDLVEPLSDEDLRKVHEPTMGPVAWDLGHVPDFEAFWLVHGLAGPDAQRAHYDPTYDALVQPRPARERLPLPDKATARLRMDETRERMLEALERADLEGGDRLVRGGFAHLNVLQHEAQHQENMLVTIQMVPGRYVPRIRAPKPGGGGPPRGDALVEAGPFVMGADLAPGVYDNEAPGHVVDLPAYRIARAPVTNGEYVRFVEAGGYDDPRWWSEDGWDMRTVLGWSRPKYWTRDADGRWWTREYDRTVPLPADQPVVHVSWYEAEAYAAWAGKRLPTEAEWEKAATWDPATGRKRAHPWGDAPWTPERANLDQRLFGPAPVGAFPAGASAYGCHQMLGDVWEWTATDFGPYEGFEAFPYDDYSVPFFDRGLKVLKGGSWATRPHVARGTFRNWHQPDHQQIFAGFRLAEDAEG